MQIVVSLILILAVMGAPAASADPFPKNDGFIYPGRAGAEGIVEFNRRWDAFSKKLPPRKNAPASQISWLLGRWDLAVGDYFYDPPAAVRIEVLGRGSCTISPHLQWPLGEV